MMSSANKLSVSNITPSIDQVDIPTDSQPDLSETSDVGLSTSIAHNIS